MSGTVTFTELVSEIEEWFDSGGDEPTFHGYRGDISKMTVGYGNRSHLCAFLRARLGTELA